MKRLNLRFIYSGTTFNGCFLRDKHEIGHWGWKAEPHVLALGTLVEGGESGRSTDSCHPGVNPGKVRKHRRWHLSRPGLARKEVRTEAAGLS